MTLRRADFADEVAAAWRAGLRRRVESRRTWRASKAPAQLAELYRSGLARP
jgi:hypothetical protein